MATESDHLRKACRTIEMLYEKYKKDVLKFGDDVPVKTVERYIGFWRRDRLFAGFHIHANHMKIGLVMKSGALDDPKKRAHVYQNWSNVRDVRDEGEFDYILGLIHQAYERK